MILTILLLLLFGQQNYQPNNYTNEIIPVSVTPKEYVLDLLPVEKYRNLEPKDIYTDVLNHSKMKPHGDQHGRYTNVHETAHGIHSELRKTYRSLLKKSINVFYCLNGQCAVIENPNIKMRHVQRYVPDILRSSRYKLYLVDQLIYWDDTPSYILDEWNCYILGAECAVDDAKRNRELEKTNAVSGSLEFSIYSVALCMAVKENDPIFWENNKQFKAFVKYNLLRAERVFNAGVVIPEFNYKEQDRLQEALLNHPDAKDIRNFLKNEFDGIFVD